MDIPIDQQVEVCFIACHPAAGAHFADFYYELTRIGKVRCRMLATEKAADELMKRDVPIHDFFYGKKSKTLKDLPEDEQDFIAETVAKICSKARYVITDVGQEFSAKVQMKLAERYPSITRIAYYDNPEAFVPGGYSTTASKVISQVQKIFFANAKLAGEALYSSPGSPMDLGGKEKIGLGYANLKDVEETREKRKERQPNPSTFAVYFGGANDVYYEQAFPRFLAILSEASKTEDLSHLEILIQQHPRAVLEGNRDGIQVLEWQKTASSWAPKIMFSTLPFNEAMVKADLALYYQTSAASKFLLAGIPTAQIGHEVYPDILVRNGLCPAILDSKQFLDLIKNFPVPTPNVQDKILSESGIDSDWPQLLIKVLSN